MHEFTVPGIVGQLHIIGDGMCEAGAFLRVLFCEGLIDDAFEMHAQVRIFGIALGIPQRLGFGAE